MLRMFSRDKKGFTLLEMLISIAIFMAVIVIVYLIFWKSRQQIDRRQMQAEATTNARTAVDALKMDLIQMGFHCDDNTEGYLGDTLLSGETIIRQPAFVYGDPWQIVFNADIDSHLAESDQLGPIQPSAGGYSFPPGPNITEELYFVYRDPNDVTGKPERLAKGRDYGSSDQGVNFEGNIGAETIRYTLDLPTDMTQGDGKVTDVDHEETYWDNKGEPENKTPNPFDYILFKEVVGQDDTGVNQHSYEPIAYGIRAWGGPPDDYVNGDKTGMKFSTSWNTTQPKPPPILQYKGHFFKNCDTCDRTDPSSVNPDEEPLDLWGDWGHNLDPFDADHIHEGDGYLCPVEIMNLYDPAKTYPYHQVGVDPRDGSLVFKEPMTGCNGECWDPNNDDLNGNGVYDTTLDDVLSEIIVTVISESRERDPGEYNNPRILNLEQDGTNAITSYPYMDTILTTQIYPRAFVAQARDRDTSAPPQTTRTPDNKLTNTPSPIPTNTDTPVLTPTPTPTPSPTITPTFTPVNCLGGQKSIVVDMNLDGDPDVVRESTDISGLKSFILTDNDFSNCLAGISNHFRIKVRSYERSQVLPTPSPEDTPIPDTWAGFTGNVDWELDIYYDDARSEVRAVMTDNNLDTGVTPPIDRPATDFDNNVDLMALDVPLSTDYGRNHSLYGALIFLDSNTYDGQADYLLIEINAESDPTLRYGAGNRKCQGCYDAFDPSINSCQGNIPYARITEPDQASASAPYTHNIVAKYSSTTHGTNLYADFYRDKGFTVNDQIDSISHEFKDINSYTDYANEEHEYIVGVDLFSEGYNCRVHDVVPISLVQTPTPTPTVTPTPTITPTNTPPCPWDPNDILKQKADRIPKNNTAKQIEFTFHNTSTYDIEFNYWLFTKGILRYANRKITQIEFKTDSVGIYKTVWSGTPTSYLTGITWNQGTAADRTAYSGDQFYVRITFDIGNFNGSQSVYFRLGPACDPTHKWLCSSPCRVTLY